LTLAYTKNENTNIGITHTLFPVLDHIPTHNKRSINDSHKKRNGIVNTFFSKILRNDIFDLDCVVFRLFFTLNEIFGTFHFRKSFVVKMYITINKVEYHVSSFEELSLKLDEIGRDAITHLYLSNNQLASLPGNVFASLGSLQRLYLHNNQLASLPENVFASLGSLQTLWLSNNQLASLPDGVFASLSSLQELYLYDNQLASLPENVFASLGSLQKLDLSNNQLTSLPENVFAPLVSLQILYLYNNQLASRPPNIRSSVDLTFDPQRVPKVFVRETKSLGHESSSSGTTCLISHDEINVGDEFRTCANPYVRHVYLHEMWETWKKTSKSDRCATCKNFVVSNVIYTRIA
jgi:hypothetical protein